MTTGECRRMRGNGLLGRKELAADAVDRMAKRPVLSRNCPLQHFHDVVSWVPRTSRRNDVVLEVDVGFGIEDDGEGVTFTRHACYKHFIAFQLVSIAR
jgi:hypothetical protein